MESIEQLKKERFFGIQKFTNPVEAFKTIKGRWTDENCDDMQNIIIKCE